MNELVLRRDEDGVATLTLNRPESLNAMNPALFVELRGHIDAIAAERDMEAKPARRNWPRVRRGRFGAVVHDIVAAVPGGHFVPRRGLASSLRHRFAALEWPASVDASRGSPGHSRGEVEDWRRRVNPGS